MPLHQAFVDLVNGSEFDAQRAAHNDSGIAAALNVQDQRGLVPIVEMARYCARGITGTIQALNEIAIGTDIAPGVPMTVQIKAALHTVLNLVQIDFRLEACDTDDAAFGQICDLLVSLGAMQSSDKAALKALGANRQSRAEVALGRLCESADVESVRKGNN
jgi:hypothetical protein